MGSADQAAWPPSGMPATTCPAEPTDTPTAIASGAGARRSLPQTYPVRHSTSADRPSG